MKNPFIKYIMKEKKKDIFHSSEYGKAQSADAIGVASAESFEKRMKIEKNRQIVQGYNDSRIMNGSYVNGPRAKKYVPPENKEQVNSVDRTKNVASNVAPKPASAVGSVSVKKSFMPPIKPKFGV